MKNGDWRINRSPSMTYEAKKKTYRTKRKILLDSLGGKCIQCGFSDYRALQVDHILGGGSIERREKSGIQLWNHMIKNISKYQILCANCNWIKRYELNEQPKGVRKESANIKEG